jgi:hypothetical protein
MSGGMIRNHNKCKKSKKYKANAPICEVCGYRQFYEEKNNKLFQENKTSPEDVCEIEIMDKGSVEHHIGRCEGKHIQQVIYSTYHKALTQICFGCMKIRTSLDRTEFKSKKDVSKGCGEIINKEDNIICGIKKWGRIPLCPKCQEKEVKG